MADRETRRGHDVRAAADRHTARVVALAYALVGETSAQCHRGAADRAATDGARLLSAVAARTSRIDWRVHAGTRSRHAAVHFLWAGRGLDDLFAAVRGATDTKRLR